MAKHTEGPWQVQEAGHLAIDTSVYDAHKRLVAATNVYGRPLEEAEANAHLIAAAPDLLEACKIALPFLEENCIGSDRPRIVREAIAKAEGGLP